MEKETREVVLAALVQQLLEAGLCRENPVTRLCLAVGKIGPKCDRDGLGKYLSEHCNGELFDSEWIGKRILALPKSQYENDVAHVAVKLHQRALEESP